MGLGPNKTTKNDEIVDEEKVKKGFFACFCLKYGFK